MTRQDPPHHAHGARLDTVHSFQPHPERIKRIRDWHQAQATAEQVPVALLSLGITDCGQVKTTVGAQKFRAHLVCADCTKKLQAGTGPAKKS